MSRHAPPLVALVVLAVAAGPASADPGSDVLAAVARYRAAAHLPPVKLDPALKAGCMKHAQYLLRNEGNAAIDGLAAHQERSDLPGATTDGAACGKAADLFVGVTDLNAAVDGFMAGIYHRRPIMDPALEKIGVGWATRKDGSYILALRFAEDDPKNGKWPVAYPADGQAGVPLDYAHEIPMPVPGGLPAGYPITLQFPPFDRVLDVGAKLVDAHGHAVAVHLSDPEHPATSFPQLGLVSVIPKQRLAADARYTITIDATWAGKHRTWSWSFTTIGLRKLVATDRKAFVAALGVASLVRGTVEYGGMMDDHTAFLVLDHTPPMVSVIVPAAVMKKLARDPNALKGKTVEVQATPQQVGDKFLNLPIETLDQIRLVPAK